MNNFTYDIVVPNYVTGESLWIVNNCLGSVRECSQGYRLILVDNASPMLGPLQKEIDKHKNVTMIRNNTNLGFVKAVNQGLRESTADYVVILNNDTEVVDNWLHTMHSAFKGNVGLVGPRSQPNGTISSELPYTKPTILSKGSMLVFFCVMISRLVIDSIGYLDEDFGVGLGDDDEYCWRAQKAGFDLCFLGDLTIKHYHKTTFNQLYTYDQIKDMGRNAVELLHQKRT